MSDPRHPLFRGLRGIIWDWGDTLMRDFPGQSGPMVRWPEVEAMAGARTALQTLSGIPVHAVATNAAESDGEAVAAALARVGLRQHLTAFFTSREMGVGKPDPAFFLEVAKRLGIAPKELLSIGNDREKDILPARAVGMRTIRVRNAPWERTGSEGPSVEGQNTAAADGPGSAAPGLQETTKPPAAAEPGSGDAHLIVCDLHELARLAAEGSTEG